MTKTLLGLMTMMALAIGGTGAGCAGDDACVGDQCTCPSADDCSHSCGAGTALCDVQGTPGHGVDVTCDHNAQCHVECSGSTSCIVDCGGSAECHVTCPSSGCTVSNCVGEECVVSCGFGEATRNGATATCP